MNLRWTGSLLLLATAWTHGCSDGGPGEELAGVSEAAIRANTIRAQARVDELGDACPGERRDALCEALRAAERATTPESAGGFYGNARDIVAARVASDPRQGVIADPAVRYFVRDRAQSLLVHYAAIGSEPKPVDFDHRVDQFLHARFPLYAAGAFPAAHAWVPPVPSARACTSPRELVLIFPGVLRSGTRVEFAAQIAGIERTLPCAKAIRIETDTFAPLAASARVAADTVARLDGEFGALPIHLLGYSQGVTNALQTLVDFPTIAARTRSFVALNSAAHGSEAIDALLAATGVVDNPNARCTDLLPFARPACEELARTSLAPVAAWAAKTLTDLGFRPEEVSKDTLAEFVRKRRGGFESLSSRGTAEFWRTRGAELPSHVLYLSFRTVISDVSANLPASNALLYGTVYLSNPQSPWNDMQVRLERHALGGPVARYEVVSHAAEGNHWQWELTPDDLGEALIPASMLAGIPRVEMITAYYETLREIGIAAPSE